MSILEELYLASIRNDRLKAFCAAMVVLWALSVLACLVALVAS